MIDHRRPVSSCDVLLVATRVDRGLPLLLRSLSLRGVHLPHLLGYGTPWGGWCTKLRLVRQALPQLRCSHVLVLDSYDSVVLEPLSVIVARYRAHRHPLVMSAQMGCWPDPDRLELHPPSPTPYRTINAGGYLAEREYLMGLFQRYPVPPDDHDDQRYWTDMFLHRPELLCLDYHQDIFSTCGSAHLEVRAGRVYNRVTGREPCVLHGNGGLSLGVVRGLDLCS